MSIIIKKSNSIICKYKFARHFYLVKKTSWKSQFLQARKITKKPKLKDEKIISFLQVEGIIFFKYFCSNIFFTRKDFRFFSKFRWILTAIFPCFKIESEIKIQIFNKGLTSHYFTMKVLRKNHKRFKLNKLDFFFRQGVYLCSNIFVGNDSKEPCFFLFK